MALLGRARMSFRSLREPDFTVIVRVLGDKAGLVRCADALSGDTSLFQRSIAAAPQWRFKPYRINGQLIVFESSIEFLFKKNKVKVL